MPVDIEHGQGHGHGPGAWHAALTERQQYIKDTAACTQCGATKRFCDLLRETNTDPTAPDWFGCCARAAGTLPCVHTEDKRELSKLLAEATTGVLRTVAEAYPPPRLGPARVSMTWLLKQAVWWYPQGRPAVRIAAMDRPHRWNIARWLERRAHRLQVADQWDLFTGFLSADMPDDVAGDILHERPLDWLVHQPLYRALTRGLPQVGSKPGLLMAARAVHWSTCPMRRKHPAPADTCVCIRKDGRTVGATNDPAVAS